MLSFLILKNFDTLCLACIRKIYLDACTSVVSSLRIPEISIFLGSIFRGLCIEISWLFLFLLSFFNFLVPSPLILVYRFCFGFLALYSFRYVEGMGGEICSDPSFVDPLISATRKITLKHLSPADNIKFVEYS